MGTLTAAAHSASTSASDVRISPALRGASCIVSIPLAQRPRRVRTGEAQLAHDRQAGRAPRVAAVPPPLLRRGCVGERLRSHKRRPTTCRPAKSGYDVCLAYRRTQCDSEECSHAPVRGVVCDSLTTLVLVARRSVAMLTAAAHNASTSAPDVGVSPTHLARRVMHRFRPVKTATGPRSDR